jgi:putative transposase
MISVNRRVTYELCPPAEQERLMWQCHKRHCDLYNAALEERISAYQKTGKSIGYAAQCRSLTEIRAEHREYSALNAQSAQVTLRRLDLAFRAFFRRVKAGEEPGFPRFKSYDRFPGFGFKHHGDGFKFEPGPNWRNGTLRLSGIGTMRARGEARTPGKIVCADIMRKADGWFLSLVIECEPYRECGNLEAGLDWGVETFTTLCHGPFQFEEIPNDRLYAQAQDEIKAAQRDLSKALRGKRSKRARRAKRLLAKRSRHLANRRKDRNHKTAATLIASHAVIAAEDLSVKNMTASAKGTAEKPGRNVRQKAGLNREILDTAPGGLHSLLAYKAEEAGCRLILLDPRKYRPSQVDPITGEIRKKALSEREHGLPDGTVIGRDQAAAWVLWRLGQDILRSERSAAATPETVARAAQAA